MNLQKRLCFGLLVFSMSVVQAQTVDPTGTYYELVGTLEAKAKLLNCKPLKHLPKKTIDVIIQPNNNLYIGFLNASEVRIFNDDAGKWLDNNGYFNDNGDFYKPGNYVVDGSVFTRVNNNLKLSRRNDLLNYLEGAQTLLEIERRQLRRRIDAGLKTYLSNTDATFAVVDVLKLPQHKYTPLKFDMKMKLTPQGKATLKEAIVAETSFVIPENPYFPTGSCTIRLTSKRSVKSAPGTSPVPFEP